MNSAQLRAMLWMRWRVLINGVRRTSKLGNLLTTIVLCVAALIAVLGLVAGFLVGSELLEDSSDLVQMMVWIGLGFGFFFSWMIGLVTELQRSDSMSYKNLMHLPVSVAWVFIYNYLGSYVSISVGLFMPAMLGFALASVAVKGPQMLICIPLVFGFFGVITALTYQFRSWLARLMEDKRKGRNVATVVTVLFVLMAQVPNMMNMSGGGGYEQRKELRERLKVEASDRGETLEGGELSQAANDYEDAQLRGKMDLACALIPLGWLPYGAAAAAEGRLGPSFLCLFGLLLIAALSLRRAYATSLAASVGAIDGKPRKAIEAKPEPVNEVRDGPKGPLFVERKLPFASELQSAIATANLRSLTRAPEGKLMLLGPIILLCMLVVMLNRGSGNPFPSVQPLMVLGATAMALLSLSNLLQNQFGLDRAGFRIYVLSPVPRKVILMGKNLGVAPLALSGGLLTIIVLQVFNPMDTQHFFGAVVQLLSAFLLICLIGNTTSIFLPMRLKDHGAQAANAKVKTILWQVLSVFLIPLVLSPLAFPFAIEYFAGSSFAGVPIFAGLHLVGLGLAWLTYRFVVSLQGEWLQEREQRILDVLTRE